MKLSEHVDAIRLLIDKSFRNRLGRMGITEKQVVPIENIPSEYHTDRQRIEVVHEVFIAETKTDENAYDKLVEELTFTLFNRLAALKVMEAHILFPEIITQREIHGSRSFAHLAWLEQHPEARTEESEGLIGFLEDQFTHLSSEIPLFSLEHSYHLLPTAIELGGILTAFNAVETDTQVETDIWQSDDVLGWLYESYNNQKKADHKASKAKTEYNKVSLQSQVYTPRWVVQFLVDNSLGKLYLEMYPDSVIGNKYKIANAPTTQTRDQKSLINLRLIDPATGSGNFILYAFDLFCDLYLDQIENYGADYDENEIAKLIIEYNLYGIDLDNRAIQLAQLGLFIKAKRKKRSVKIDHFNVVSSDFYLPPYEEVQSIFETNTDLDSKQKEIIRNIWTDLQQAYKFGSLIRLEEKLSISLHGLASAGVTLFSNEEVENYEQFRKDFFVNLKHAVEQNAARHGHTFLNAKTQDAITFLQLLTQKYDVAVANPPYTDSSNFGTELKLFIDTNYKQPYKFNTNLYAAFIKRCCELSGENGFVGIIHPNTFMFIKTFEDVRKYLIENTHIELLVDYGLDRVNLFGPGIILDATWYVLSKIKKNEEGVYFNIKVNQQERYKKSSLEKSYDDFVKKQKNDRVYYLPQLKLKIIDGWPFIYWISDGFREKFKEANLEDEMRVCTGLSTANNSRFLRFWWEIERNEIGSEWKMLAKGGPYNKWWGNVWLTVNWKNNGEEIRDFKSSGKAIRNEKYYFKKGITNSLISVKGISNRLLPKNTIFDITAPSIFAKSYSNIYYSLGYLNSKLVQYIADCLNPTAALTWGDLQKMPFIIPSKIIENSVSILSEFNVKSKKILASFSLIETNFDRNALMTFENISLRDRLLNFLNFENISLTKVFLNEAIINELIYDAYEISDWDRRQIETSIGLSIGEMGVGKYELSEFKKELEKDDDLPENYKNILNNHLDSLQVDEFDKKYIDETISEFSDLYQSNNDLEEFSIRHKLNPINIWCWFRDANILPQARTQEITLEFLADAIRTILIEDEDGIIPLVGLPGEPRLLDRLEQHCLAEGFTSAQFMQLDSLLGRSINEYIEQYFFHNLSSHLNLFPNLPKTPFIWHLSSGKQQGFEVYLIIYKWQRDSLFKLKSQYLTHRVENLEYRLIQLQGVETAQSQNEKETIRFQLREIEAFTTKIDKLIAEGYSPILDDGVGKNIAPLQNNGLLKADVLNNNQLKKYLNADW